MSTSPRKILITSALPYANGSIHLGHMLEHIQTDIWKRFQLLQGNDCISVCADDSHGTAIMIKAQEQSMTPEAWIKRIQQEHEADLQAFHVDYDNYHSTHSEENRRLSEMLYQRNKDAGNIVSREIKQLYDPERAMFLADRFVKGDCPKCKSPDQYGDNCEVCGATYAATELGRPKSVYSGAVPELKATTQLFFDLPKFTDMLKTWTREHLQEEIANKLAEWLDGGLKQWDITRPAPYFGFEVPDHPNMFFYVWMDAPIGYMASFQNLCAKRDDLDFDEYWGPDSTTELYHFIGKDIINFHGLFWPAMLEGANLRKPNHIFTHGYVTINGEKMSKSRGTFIQASTFAEHLNVEALRYYYAAKLTNKVDDLDLNLEDFAQRVNSDLVNKLVNIASRTAGFIKKSGGQLSAQISEPDLLGQFQAAATSIGQLYENREFAKAMREIMGLAQIADRYIDDKAPWRLAKQESSEQAVLDVCSTGINMFRLLVIYLKPVVPALAAKSEAFLNVEPLVWSDSQTLLRDHSINKFKPLMQRIEQKQLDSLITAAKAEAGVSSITDKTSIGKNVADNDKNTGEPASPATISFDDFAKIELRVARIVKAEAVEKADKLLQLTLDLGDETKNVFAGIKSAYTTEQLEGRLTVMVANLAPRKMRFGVSEGMVLAAGPGGEDIFLLSPDEGAKPGMIIK